MFNSKSLTGGWIVIPAIEGATTEASYFGYQIKTIMSWEGQHSEVRRSRRTPEPCSRQ